MLHSFKSLLSSESSKYSLLEFLARRSKSSKLTRTWQLQDKAIAQLLDSPPIGV
ncbi:MAG: hypothetical protein SAK29_21115 [Scytonema sp. PMC 1069.18]|nr:hypothetical protein [Scytonema sp. PMC 1069.18]MEC4880884.1 hypothetical protein [Scytonema sp. PMC 1070.18]